MIGLNVMLNEELFLLVDSMLSTNKLFCAETALKSNFFNYNSSMLNHLDTLQEEVSSEYPNFGFKQEFNPQRMQNVTDEANPLF